MNEDPDSGYDSGRGSRFGRIDLEYIRVPGAVLNLKFVGKVYM